MFSIDKNKNKELAGVGFEGGTPSLGTIAKSTSIPAQEHRAKRFNLLNKIRDLYVAEGRKKGLEIPTKYHRTSLCKHACTGSAGVELNLLPEARKAFYRGLQTCGSVWTCPVCSHKIQEVRRLELVAGLHRLTQADQEFIDKDGVIHQPQDYQAVMVTFTFPHTVKQSLDFLVESFNKALSLFKSGDGFVGFKNKFKYLGQIRAFEVTYGSNGWHVHTHELFFVGSNICEKEFVKAVKSRWVYACVNAGLIDETSSKFKAFNKHAVDIKFNCTATDYFAKQDNVKHWGIDKEIVKSASKTSKDKKGFHPFALADENKHNLWIEYTEVMTKRRVRQLRWSQGLKKIAEIEDIDDQDASTKEGKENLIIIGLLNKPIWKEVLKKELRAKVLDLAEDEYNIDYIRSFILDGEDIQNE